MQWLVYTSSGYGGHLHFITVSVHLTNLSPIFSLLLVLFFLPQLLWEICLTLPNVDQLVADFCLCMSSVWC